VGARTRKEKDMSDDAQKTDDGQAKGDDGTAAKLAEMQASMAEMKSQIGSLTDQKKRAREEADSLKAQLDEIEDAKLSAKEKVAKELEKAKEIAAQAQADAKKAREEMAAEKRNIEIAGVAAGIPFLDGVSPENRTVLLGNLFDGVDMTNKELVDAMVDKWQGDNKALLRADGVGNGTGTKGGTPGAAPAKDITPEGIRGMSSEEFAKNKDQLYKMAAAEAAAA